jgi:hypothetical protein
MRVSITYSAREAVPQSLALARHYCIDEAPPSVPIIGRKVAFATVNGECPTRSADV